VFIAMDIMTTTGGLYPFMEANLKAKKCMPKGKFLLQNSEKDIKRSLAHQMNDDLLKDRLIFVE
jgi:hypothetical protein